MRRANGEVVIRGVGGRGEGGAEISQPVCIARPLTLLLSLMPLVFALVRVAWLLA